MICASGVNRTGAQTAFCLSWEFHQAELLRQVYVRADVAPDSVVYVEAHGTGTQVGDTAEASALGAALGQRRARPLPIGSVKTNIGHTEPAAGLAGRLKAMSALEHDQAPKSLHFDRPNPNIDFNKSNLIVTAERLIAEGRSLTVRRRQLVWIWRHQRPCRHQRSAGASTEDGASAAIPDAFRSVRRGAASDGRRIRALLHGDRSDRDASHRRGDRLPTRAHAGAFGAARRRRGGLGSALTQSAELGRLGRAAARGTAVDGDGSDSVRFFRQRHAMAGHGARGLP